MKGRKTGWVAGLAGSVALHGAAGIALIWALQPEPIPPQNSPVSRLAVQTQQLERAAAQEQSPSAQDVSPAAPDGTRLAQGVVRQSVADAAPVSAPLAPSVTGVAEPLSATQIDGQPTTESDTTDEKLMPSAPVANKLRADTAEPLPTTAIQPEASVAPATQGPIRQAMETPAIAQPVSAMAQPAHLAPLLQPQTSTSAAVSAPAAHLPTQPLSAAPAVPATLPTQNVDTLAAQSAALPVSVVSAQTNTQRIPVAVAAIARTAPVTVQPMALTPDVRPGRVIPQQQAKGQTVDTDTPTPAVVPQITPQVTKTAARLAFNSGQGVTDPVSLAAYQSFVAPETLRPGENIRDGLSDLLGAIPCARMQAQFQPETGALALVGHVPDARLRGSLVQAMQAQVGADIAVVDNLRVLPSPQCDALSGIASVGLPQSTDQITNPLLVGPDTFATEFSFSEGETLVLEMTAPDYDAFLYVDYFDASGQVIHLSPNDTVPLIRANAKSRVTIGARSRDEPGLLILIGPPFGQEIAVAFASSVPLFETSRPIVEPATPYLRQLSERVAQARADSPDFKGEWVYFFVSTSP